MSRIAATFDRLRAGRRAALVPFVTAGDPSPAHLPDMLRSLVANGADVIELGVPFSDPMADGPTIQRSSERALRAGTGLAMILDAVKQYRREDDRTPIVLMGYANPIEHMGVAAFAGRAKESGVDGVLVVDLPWEESAELKRVTDPLGIRFIYLIAPTSGEERIRAVAAKASGFLYYISVTGVTGTQLPVADGIEADVANIRKYAQVPIAVGFGISNAATAREIAGKADGIVIGSAIMKIIAEDRGGDLVKKIREFASEVSKGVSGA